MIQSALRLMIDIGSPPTFCGGELCTFNFAVTATSQGSEPAQK
jgi:hypothetical protein